MNGPHNNDEVVRVFAQTAELFTDSDVQLGRHPRPVQQTACMYNTATSFNISGEMIKANFIWLEFLDCLTSAVSRTIYCRYIVVNGWRKRISLLRN